jgi:hypothetical protein
MKTIEKDSISLRIILYIFSAIFILVWFIVHAMVIVSFYHSRDVGWLIILIFLIMMDRVMYLLVFKW